jgi:hypothetical protein
MKNVSYESWSFITLFTRACRWPIQSTPSHCINIPLMLILLLGPCITWKFAVLLADVSVVCTQTVWCDLNFFDLQDSIMLYKYYVGVTL